jgi:hypothetical protein
MSLGLGMLLALAIVVLGGFGMAAVVILLRNRDDIKSAKTASSADKSAEQKQ